MKLTLPKVHRIMQAASKRFDAPNNRYAAKPLLYDKFSKNKFIKVPRICPPTYKIQNVCMLIYDKLGTQLSLMMVASPTSRSTW